MGKIEIPLTGYAHETSEVLRKCGCLLVTGNMEKANVMTIGWGLMGMLWSKPVFMIAVRPSRHTFNLIEQTGEFTVCVPRKGMEEIVEYCGTVSGRDENKIEKKGLVVAEGKMINTPTLSDCVVNYECRVIFKTKISPEQVPEDAKQRWYPEGNFHTIYFGEILFTTAEEDAASQMPE